MGHAGTLDPMATGVLPVFLGRATRAVEFAAESEKEYIAALRLGVITDTQDITGSVLETRPVAAGREELEALIREQGKAELTCQFCDQAYHYSREALEALLASL